MKTVEELRSEYAAFVGRQRADAKTAVQSTSQKEMLIRLEACLDDLNVHVLAMVDLLKKKKVITEQEYLAAIVSKLNERY